MSGRLKIGITGGIGSGKSYVCRLLNRRGLEVYDCDRAAKRLMRESEALREALTALIGADAYHGEVLNKPVVAAFMMQSEANTLAVNAIVHPAVFRDFEQSGMLWVESAIIFESGLWQYVDRVLCVTAPREVRIQRVMERDGISCEKTLEWMDKQMSQDEVLARSDYEIVNDGLADLDNQVDRLLVLLAEEQNKDNVLPSITKK